MTTPLATRLTTERAGGVPLWALFPELYLTDSGPMQAAHATDAESAAAPEDRSAALCCAALAALTGGRFETAARFCAAVVALSGDEGSTWFAASISSACRMAEINWWPEHRGADLTAGGSEQRIDDLGEPVRPAVVDPVVALAVSLLESLGIRRIVRALLSAPPPPTTTPERFDEVSTVVVQRLRVLAGGDHGPTWLADFAELTEADRLLRTGRCDEADGILAALPAPSPLIAYRDVLRGDALVVRGSVLDHPIASWVDVEPSALRAAVVHHRRALQFYRAGGSSSGAAACGLRVALVQSALAGRLDEQAFAAAEQDALAAGDDGLRWLVRTHRVLAALQLRGLWPTEWVGQDERLQAWARDERATGYADGVVEMFHVSGQALAERDDVERATCALRLGIAGALVLESVAPELRGRTRRLLLTLADIRRRRGLRLPAVVVLHRLLDEARHQPLDDPLSWLEALNWALAAREAWIGERNHEGIVAIDRLAAELLGRRPAGLPAALDPASTALAEAVSTSSILVPLYRGTELQEEGRPDEARVAYDQAIAAATVLDDPFVLYVVYGTVLDLDAARTHLYRYASGPSASAALVLQGAITLGEWQLAGGLLPTAVASPTDAPWEGSATRAEVLLHLGDLPGALSAAREGVARFADVLSHVTTDLSRTALTDSYTVLQLVTSGAAAAVEGGRADEGLALVDWLRATPVLGTMTMIDAAPDAHEAVVRSWLSVMGQWSALHEAARSSPSAVLDPSEVEAALARSELAVERAVPGLIGRAAIGRLPDRLEEVRAAIPDGSALIELHAGNDELLIWTLTNDRCEGRRIPFRTRQLMQEVGEVLRWCARGVGGAETVDRLAAKLLAPIAGDITSVPRLIISAAGGGLGLLPLHMFPVAGVPLCERAVVGYVPAASLIPVLRSRNSRADQGPALVVGGCVYAPETGLSELPGTLREAVDVGRRYSVVPLTGETATRKAVLDQLPGAAVVHLASHGIVDPVAPSASRIALSGREAVTLPDLLATQMHARLVVLSACDTGRGRAARGGDVAGLTRSLLTAGAAACVVSFWPVDDDLAADQMIAFHASPQVTTDPAAALGEAYRVTGSSGPRRDLRRSASRDAGDEAVGTIRTRPSWAAFGYVGV